MNEINQLTKRYALPTKLAKRFSEHPEREALIVAIEEFRTADGQCLPRTCAIVVGTLAEALVNKDAEIKLLRFSDGKLSSLTLDKVTDWCWVTSPDHRGKVPVVTRQERKTWSRLADQQIRSKSENALYRALTRKITYRAKREIDSHRWA